LPGWEGLDASAGCGAPLYAPLSGIVTYNGADGYVGPYGGPSSLLTIMSDGGTAVSLLHGRYVTAVGQRVQAGETLIGFEAAVGNATGCHTHLVVGAGLAGGG
jgi:murein DD-endopeptidase MepM/ murein hydrolase activator NlpD